MQMVMSGRTVININGEVDPYFPTAQGVRQGDPFSPFLFNLVVDALTAILDRAKGAGHLSGLCHHLLGAGGMTHLQYADDTILVVEGSYRDIAHLKFLRLCFQEMSGLTISFAKSEVMVLGYSDKEKLSIANRLNCRLGTFATTYLGMPISDSRILEKDLRPSVTKVQHRVEPWKGRWPSKAARVFLINSSLTSLLMYLMGFYSLNESLHHDIAKYQSRFFLAGKAINRNITWSNGLTYVNPRTRAVLGLYHPNG
ncbi:ABC transporter G family member 37 [Hordeum vulgare]|nr:ABC transporter G family member 37 [Hordeum vulgare]